MHQDETGLCHETPSSGDEGGTSEEMNRDLSCNVELIPIFIQTLSIAVQAIAACCLPQDEKLTSFVILFYALHQ